MKLIVMLMFCNGRQWNGRQNTCFGECGGLIGLELVGTGLEQARTNERLVNVVQPADDEMIQILGTAT